MRKIFGTFSLRNFDFILVGMIVLLNLIGIQAVGAAAPSLERRQVQGMIIGLVLMVLVSLVDYNRILKYYWVWYILSLVLLAMVLLFGESGGGAQRWISIGGLRFQPSEAAKILLILFYAKIIIKYKNRMKSFAFILALLALAAIPLIMVLRQPDLSTTIMLFLIISVMLFVGGLSFKVVGAVLAVAIPSVIIFLNLVVQEGQTLIPDYQRRRIMAWLHPEDYETTDAYQTMNSIMAIGSGMLTGKGQNAEGGFTSLLKGGYISQSQTDFIFTVIAEESGFVGACTVIILLTLITIRLFWICRDAKDTSGALIAAGMGAWIGFQGFMNISVATGVIPNTGIPLPFVSYGLTSLVSLYMGIGFVLNVRMQTRAKRQQTFEYGSIAAFRG